MIYSDDFVWLHFPKNAGTKIEKIFKKYYIDETYIKQDDVTPTDKTICWHDSIQERQVRDNNFEIEGKKVIICVRRLTDWLISRYNFEAKRSPHLQHDYHLLLEGAFLESSGYLNRADNYIHRYIPDELLVSGEIIYVRVENFKDDFLEAFSGFIDVSKIPDGEFDVKVNKSINTIPDSFLEVLKEKEKSIYHHCPKWKKIEELAYGKP